MKVKMYVETNKVGSRCERDLEIPDEDLEDLDQWDKEVVIDQYIQDALPSLANWGWYEK